MSGAGPAREQPPKKKRRRLTAGKQPAKQIMLADLPTEIQLAIAETLDLQSLGRVAQVSRQFRAVSKTARTNILVKKMKRLLAKINAVPQRIADFAPDLFRATTSLLDHRSIYRPSYPNNPNNIKPSELSLPKTIKAGQRFPYIQFEYDGRKWVKYPSPRVIFISRKNIGKMRDILAQTHQKERELHSLTTPRGVTMAEVNDLIGDTKLIHFVKLTPKLYDIMQSRQSGYESHYGL